MNPLTHRGVAAALAAAGDRPDATLEDRAVLAGRAAQMRAARDGVRDPEALRTASREARLAFCAEHGICDPYAT